jgi:hypothetical protein
VQVEFDYKLKDGRTLAVCATGSVWLKDDTGAEVLGLQIDARIFRDELDGEGFQATANEILTEWDDVLEEAIERLTDERRKRHELT